jgi:hypothetical protein
MAFTPVQDGDLAVAPHVQQILDALSGVAGAGPPISLTSLNSAADPALKLRNLNASGDHLLVQKSTDGTTLLEIDDTFASFGGGLFTVNFSSGAVSLTGLQLTPSPLDPNPATTAITLGTTRPTVTAMASVASTTGDGAFYYAYRFVGLNALGKRTAPSGYTYTGGYLNSITITNGGGGYGVAPTITISAPGNGGTTATATCTINLGIVNSITVTNPGSGYTSVPTVTFSSGAAAGTAVIFGQRNTTGPGADAQVIGWTALTGATSYQLYRTITSIATGTAYESERLLATVAATTPTVSYTDDDGAATVTTAISNQNTTAYIQAGAIKATQYMHVGDLALGGGDFNLPNSTFIVAGTYRQSHQAVFVDAGFVGTLQDGGASQFISRDYGFNQTRTVQSLALRGTGTGETAWAAEYAGHTGNGWLLQPYQGSLALVKRGAAGTNQDYTIFGITGCNEATGLYLINQAYPLAEAVNGGLFTGSMANNGIYIGGQDGFEYGFVMDDTNGTAAGGGVPLAAIRLYNRGDPGVSSTPVALGWLGLGVDPTARLHISRINEAATDKMMIIDALNTNNAADQIAVRSSADSNQRLLVGYHTTNAYGSISARTTADAVAPLVFNYAGGPIVIGQAPTGLTAALNVKQIADNSAGGLLLHESANSDRTFLYSGADDKAYLGRIVSGQLPTTLIVGGQVGQTGLQVSTQTGHTGALLDLTVNNVSQASVRADGLGTFNGVVTKYAAGAASDAAWTSAPPNGTLYARSDGGAGTYLYVRIAGAWVAV